MDATNEYWIIKRNEWASKARERRRDKETGTERDRARECAWEWESKLVEKWRREKEKVSQNVRQLWAKKPVPWEEEMTGGQV
jgi:hypothetical protein